MSRRNREVLSAPQNPILSTTVQTMVTEGVPMEDAIKMFRAAYITNALIATRGNQCKAARLIQTHRNTLCNWMREFDIRVR